MSGADELPPRPPGARPVSDAGERAQLTARATEANRLAWRSYQDADYATTLRHAAEALEAATASGDLVLQAEALSHQGHVYAGLGDYARALDLHQQGVQLCRDIGDREGLGRPLAGLANLYGALGDHDAQRRVFSEALEIAVSTGHPQSLASALVGLGIAHLAAGDAAQAEALLQHGIETARACDFPYLEIVGSDHLAQAAVAQGRLGDAHRLFTAALARAREVHNRKAEAQLRQRLGALLLRQRLPQEALAELETADRQAHELGFPRLLEDIHAARSEAYEAAGDAASALHHLRAQVALERARLSEDSRQRANVLAVQHRLAWAQQEAEMQRTQAAAMERQAHHDPLTGLPNRAGFSRHLAGRLQAGGAFALLFLDLDGFKAVNDRLGHDAGDQLLAAVARVFGALLAPGDVVARMGGDEFTFCAAQGPTAQGPMSRDALLLAQELLRALERPFVVAGEEVFVTASIGVTWSPEQGSDAGTLLRQADLAMYGAKRAGRNKVRAHVPGSLPAAPTPT